MAIQSLRLRSSPPCGRARFPELTQTPSRTVRARSEHGYTPHLLSTKGAATPLKMKGFFTDETILSFLGPRKSPDAHTKCGPEKILSLDLIRLEFNM